MQKNERKTESLPANLLTPAEVIEALRLDVKPDGTPSRATGLRRLKYLRDMRRIPHHRLGHKTYLYPRTGIERFKKQTLVEAVL